MLTCIRDRVAPHITAVIMVFLVSSCYTSRQSAPDIKDLSYVYNPARNIFTPSVSLYNEDSETTVLSVSLRRDELYFSEANPEGVPKASILLSVKLFDQTLGGNLADTANYKYDLLREDVGGGYAFRIPLKAYDSISYTVALKIIDLIRQRTVQIFIDFDRTGPYSGLNYKVRDHFSKNEVFSDILKPNQFINVLSPSLQPDTLWLFYYKSVRELPPPPSTVLPEVTLSPEPELIIPVPYSDTLPIMFPRDGIYMLSPDSLIREGLVLFNFGDDHPSFTSPETMIPPLGYIATREEMESLLAAEKPKLALDEFWLNRTGSIERSKELIRIYYNRTLFANYYFSSYKQGWLTDRGMMYIIYGPPDKVYKNVEGESWGYKMPPVKSAWGAQYSSTEEYLWFNFSKKKNLFSQNDFVLNRASTPISYWDIAVARWREGKVFRLETATELQ